MSIIERAIDKMGDKPRKDQEVTDKKLSPRQRARREEDARKAGELANAIEARENQTQIPELDEAIEAKYKRPATKVEDNSEAGANESDNQMTSSESVTPEDVEVVDPDILISKLGIEGILSAEGGRSRLAEEYRLIKRPLLVKAFSNSHQDQSVAGIVHNNVIMVSSSVAGEGKTFTSLNLAISIAMEMDQTVLLIDSDLAKPGLSKMLDIRGEQGLTDYLSGNTKDIGSLFKKTDIPKLTVLAAGTAHSRSTELLASRAMGKLLDELAQRYSDRVVIFDSPPLLATTESVVLSRQMGQICLVVESSSTPQYMVKQALGSLHSTDNVSLILNKVKPDLLSTGYAYGYGYGQGYGEKA